jgi:hypothetical protein
MQLISRMVRIRSDFLLACTAVSFAVKDERSKKTGQLYRHVVWLAIWWGVAVALVWLVGGRLEQAGEAPIAGESAEAGLKALWANARTVSGGRILGNTSYFHTGEAVQVVGTIEFTGNSSDGLERLERSYAAAGWSIDGEARGHPA